MLRRLNKKFIIISLFFTTTVSYCIAANPKTNSEEALLMLKSGNERFITGKSIHPHADTARLTQADNEDQADYAYATIITCSDSRVPVEIIFDAGIMDIFVIRVAGNVCNVDEIGSIEYGLAHVKTPLLIVLGHTQCGAVKAVIQSIQGKGHALERNIPPLVESITPAVKRAMMEYPKLEGDAIVPYAIEENVWQSIENLFIASPATHNLIKDGRVRVVGAIYDVGTGKINWLSEEKVKKILDKAEKNPTRAMNAMAE